MTLPMMILVDQKGNVVTDNIFVANLEGELKRLLGTATAQGGAGVRAALRYRRSTNLPGPAALATSGDPQRDVAAGRACRAAPRTAGRAATRVLLTARIIAIDEHVAIDIVGPEFQMLASGTHDPSPNRFAVSSTCLNALAIETR